MNEKEGVVQFERNFDNQSLFCNGVYNYTSVTICAYALLFVFFVVCVYMILQFLLKKNLFPIRERAPRIAALQCIAFLVLIADITLVETGTGFGFWKWDEATTRSEIPTSRVILKSIYISVRINIYTIFALRIGVIYYNWKGARSSIADANEPQASTTVISSCIAFFKKILGKERNCLYLIALWVPFCFLMCVFYGDSFKTGYPALDWYMPHNQSYWAAFLNGTTLHIFEVVIMTISLYIHRQFPEEFNLNREIMVNLITGWIFNSLTDFANAMREDPSNPTCIFLMIRGDAFVDIVRCLTLVGIIYIIAVRQSTNFPLPYTWIFSDFTKFMFEPKCVHHFLIYLQRKEEEKLPLLQNLMRLYNEDFSKSKLKRGSSLSPGLMRKTSEVFYSVGSNFGSHIKHTVDTAETTNRQQFLENLEKLEDSFERFKTTKSAQVLFGRLREFEMITEQAMST